MRQVLYQAVLTLLKPLIRILLHNGIPYAVFADLARWVYVDLARHDFGKRGRKASDSRISIVTGLNRKEVARLKRITRPHSRDAVDRYNRAARVIAGWVRDPLYNDASGTPLPLPFDGGKISFHSLVKTYSGDMPAKALLDELMDVGTVKQNEERMIHLLERAYIPRTGELEKYRILGVDVADLIGTIGHNVESAQSRAYFQRKVAYDNISGVDAEAFRLASHDKSQGLLEEFDRFLSQRDRDLHPELPEGERKRVGVGIYYFEEDVPCSTMTGPNHGQLPKR